MFDKIKVPSVVLAARAEADRLRQKCWETHNLGGTPVSVRDEFMNACEVRDRLEDRTLHLRTEEHVILTKDVSLPGTSKRPTRSAKKGTIYVVYRTSEGCVASLEDAEGHSIYPQMGIKGKFFELVVESCDPIENGKIFAERHQLLCFRLESKGITRDPMLATVLLGMLDAGVITPTHLDNLCAIGDSWETMTEFHTALVKILA